MKPFFAATLAGASMAVLCLASHSEKWPVRETETIQKTLSLSAAPMRLVVDNVEGYVHVTGISGTEVRVTAHKSTRAETDADLQQAKAEVKLDIEGKPGSVSVYYDAPWRCNGSGDGCRGEHRHFYEVSYNLDIEVPNSARTVVSTVNDGGINIENTAGNFDVNNVNGGVRLSSISGSGDAHTVNGPVMVQFARNPSAACSFKSINGQMDVYFRPDLSAELFFKTFNGQIYSDFDVAPRPAPTTVADRRNGKFVYRSNGLSAGRAGTGGPELTFDAFNGNIRLHREQ